MLLDVVTRFKMSPLLVVYDEPESVVLWKDFVEAELRSNVMPPKFIQISSDDDEQKILSVGSKVELLASFVSCRGAVAQLVERPLKGPESRCNSTDMSLNPSPGIRW